MSSPIKNMSSPIKKMYRDNDNLNDYYESEDSLNFYKTQVMVIEILYRKDSRPLSPLNTSKFAHCFGSAYTEGGKTPIKHF